MERKVRGLEVSEARRLKSLEDEKRLLKKLLAESMLDNAVAVGRRADLSRTSGREPSGKISI